MPSVVFENDGLVEIDALRTFGVSIKEHDNPIGHFGTGFKYAIAILLRHNQSVQVFVGETRHTFDTEEVMIRNQPFQIIRMDGEKLGFTTHLGSIWELWQAYRELYANTKDEQGTIYDTYTEVKPEPDKTKIVVSGSDFLNLHYNKGEFILEKDPFTRTDDYQVIEGETHSLFYQGFKVYHSDIPFRFTYNFTRKMDLSEDRTLRDTHHSLRILAREVLAFCEDIDFIKRVILCPEGFVEAGYDFLGLGHNPSSAFIEAVEDLAKTNITDMNESAHLVVKKVLKNKYGPPKRDLEPEEQQVVDRACQVLQKMGYNPKEYPIYAAEELGTNTLAIATEGTIILSRDCILEGHLKVTIALFEEFVHLKYGFPDESRLLQDFLIRRYITLGMKVYEGTSNKPTGVD